MWSSRAAAGSRLAIGLLVPAVVVATMLNFLMAARGEPGDRGMFDMAVGLVRDGDADLRAVALEQIRDGFPGVGFSEELAEQLLPTLPRAVQTLLISTLAERGDPAALPGILSLAARTEDTAVTAAAVAAAGRLGGAEEVPMLVAAVDEPATKAAARRALVAIQGPGVAAALRQAVADAAVAAPRRAVVAAVLADRRDREAVGELARLAGGQIPQLRAAAMQALARLARPEDLPGLLDGFLAAAPGREREAAERLIVVAGGDGAARDQAANIVVARYRQASPAEQAVLLPLLGRFGGPRSRAVIEPLLASPDRATRLAGIAAIGRWPDASMVDRIRELLETATDAEERRLLVAALIRIAPMPESGLDDADRLALVEQTMKLCESDTERRRLLERAAAIRTVATLRFLTPFLDEPELAEAAARGVVALAHHRRLRDGHPAEFTAALDRVLTVAKDPVTRERADRYQQGKTWKRP